MNVNRLVVVSFVVASLVSSEHRIQRPLRYQKVDDNPVGDKERPQGHTELQQQLQSYQSPWGAAPPRLSNE